MKFNKTRGFHPLFLDEIGALDGTHIQTYISTAGQAAWCNRKGLISPNVFTVCSFDLRFTFIHMGWQTTLRTMLSSYKMQIPKQGFRVLLLASDVEQAIWEQSSSPKRHNGASYPLSKLGTSAFL